MAVPRNRTSNARKNARRSHHAKTPTGTCICSNCKNKRLTHKACLHCGHYAGRSLVRGSK